MMMTMVMNGDDDDDDDDVAFFFKSCTMAARKVEKKTKKIKHTSSHWKPGERPRRMRKLKAELEKLRAEHDELICLRWQVKKLKERNAEYIAEIGSLQAFAKRERLQYRQFKLQSRTESDGHESNREDDG